MIDISILVRPGTPEWPGDTPYSCGWTWSMAAGASVNVSAVTTSPHVGTHADAPLHVRDGWPGSEALALDAFVGPALVLGIEGARGAIELAALAEHIPAGTERLLLRTGHSIAGGRFPDEWPALSAACATALAARGLRLLGVDCPSVDERESKALDTHQALFSAGAHVLENLDLRGVPDGPYQLLALPLRLHGLDAAPVRAVLKPE
ncbi:MAG TPA: cyclase family protein [Gemmatimonadaceae bacterium]|nr:cyclase family protein [Gemmatimonadaceae bacterium]